MRGPGRQALLGVVVGLLAAGRAEAAGFAVREQSSAAQGNAFAGATSGAENLSYMFFNPATLGRLDGYQVEVQGSYLSPHSKVKDAAATTVAGTREPVKPLERRWPRRTAGTTLPRLARRPLLIASWGGRRADLGRKSETGGEMISRGT